MNFNDYDFLTELKTYLESKIKGVNVYNYRNVKKSQFPVIILFTETNSADLDTLDSSRKIKYMRISVSIEVYTKDTTKMLKEQSCANLKNQVINAIEDSKFKNLQLTYDRNLPNLDTNICRWRLTYDATINTQNNGII